MMEKEGCWAVLSLQLYAEVYKRGRGRGGSRGGWRRRREVGRGCHSSSES